jgi:DNA ligase-1
MDPKFKPMLAGRAEDLSKIRYPIIATEKLDGIRCLIIDGVAYSRKMLPLPNRRLQEIASRYKDKHYDGELLCPGEDFNFIQSKIMSEDGDLQGCYYYVFDTISERAYLERIIDIGQSDNFKKSLGFKTIGSEQQLEEYLQICLRNGFEGAMIRQPDSPYKFGRSTEKEQYLLKLKVFHDTEGVVVGFKERLHNTNEQEKDELGNTKRSSKKAGMVATNTLGSLELDMNGVTVSVGSGFDDAQRQDFWNRRDELHGKTVTFKYQELTKYGVPRFPVFMRFRED